MPSSIAKKIVQSGVNTTASAEETLTREQALSAVPIRNEAVLTQYVENGEALLIFHVQQKAWFASLVRLMKKKDTFSLEKRLQLDEIGTLIWQISDGHTSVIEMIDLLCKRYQLHRKEAEKSLLAFLRMLGERGLIAMELKYSPGS
jgi:hypothetical protein